MGCSACSQLLPSRPSCSWLPLVWVTAHAASALLSTRLLLPCASLLTDGHGSAHCRARNAQSVGCCRGRKHVAAGKGGMVESQREAQYCAGEAQAQGCTAAWQTPGRENASLHSRADCCTAVGCWGVDERIRGSCRQERGKGRGSAAGAAHVPPWLSLVGVRVIQVPRAPGLALHYLYWDCR